jgi:hypothetical protein
LYVETRHDARMHVFASRVIDRLRVGDWLKRPDGDKSRAYLRLDCLPLPVHWRLYTCHAVYYAVTAVFVRTARRVTTSGLAYGVNLFCLPQISIAIRKTRLVPAQCTIHRLKSSPAVEFVTICRIDVHDFELKTHKSNQDRGIMYPMDSPNRSFALIHDT